MSISKRIKDTAFIVVAGGSSERFGGGNKLFSELEGIPLFIYPLRTAIAVMEPENIVIAVPPDQKIKFAELIEKHLPCMKIPLVHGGKNRTESVYNVLKTLAPEKIKIVAIHDAARPLLSEKLLSHSIDMARKYSAAITCRKVCDTIKSANIHGKIEKTIPRENLWAAETPQVFEFRKLLYVYHTAIESGEIFTDDSQIIERFTEIQPHIVENKLPNIKITYREDILTASALMRSMKK